MIEEEMSEAEALHAIARSLRELGNADANTPMGALEAHGAVIKESTDQLSEALLAVATAISDGLHELAEALRPTP